MTISEQHQDQNSDLDTDVAGVREDEHTEHAPLFRRYSIPVSADVRVGAVPMGGPLLGR